ncbi:hypothetical protein SAY86_013652 [Trapa natans]|uniref:Uncharacterized protein n=1 Tax=Trapa natans TaxID=22666 RepID=A0AAN7KZK8_TRANT|nr:hypothetical protein SAY86_013652 [Trapa natans]
MRLRRTGTLFRQETSSAMELLKLSKFKLQLRALVSEVRDLREREESAKEQLHIVAQKQKQTDEEYGRRVQELQAELGSSDEIRRKLQRKIDHLQEENLLLEDRQKELNATIQGLVQSRDEFIHAYEESTCEMRRAIVIRDRKLAMLSEKVNYHLLLFDSIEKEAQTVKQIVDNVNHLVSEKEELGMSVPEVFPCISKHRLNAEKICGLENKMKRDEEKLKRKDRIISELEAQLEASKISNNYQTYGSFPSFCFVIFDLSHLQRTLSAKDDVIRNLLSEKKALLFELGNMATVLQKVHDTFTDMNEEDKRKFASTLGNQQGVCLVKDETNGDPRDGNDLHIRGEGSLNENGMKDAATDSESSLPPNQMPRGDMIMKNKFESVSELARSSSQSAQSEPQSTDHAQGMLIKDGKRREDEGTST